MSAPVRRVRWLVDEPGAPAWNLAFDETLLLGRGVTVRVYGWDPPGLSLGYFQEFAAIERAPSRRPVSSWSAVPPAAARSRIATS